MTRQVCRDYLANSIVQRDALRRPIFYVDFDRYGRSLKEINQLLGILKNETDETLGHLRLRVLNWATARRFDGTTQSSMAELLANIDDNKLFLVLDNVDASQSPLLQSFIRAAQGLLRSFVLVVINGEPPDANTDSLRLGPFDLNETRDYLNKFEPSKAQEAESWHTSTGGFPILLEYKRSRNEDIALQVNGFTAALINVLKNSLRKEGMSFACKLVHFPNGIDANFAWEFLREDWRNAEELINQDIVLREYRSGNSGIWARLPQVVSNAIKENFPEEVLDSEFQIAETFLEHFGEMDEGEVVKAFDRLLERPGGIGFLHNMHVVLSDTDHSESRSLPLLVHEWLFEHGRWYDCYEFWKRALTAAENVEVHEWLKFAKTAHVLGLVVPANEALENARQGNPSQVDRIDLISTEAALLKDAAKISACDELLQMYADGLSIIKAELAKSDCDRVLLETKRAIFHYDRSLVLAFWSHDLTGALKDLEFARSEFERLNKRHMRALADCEYADVQLKEASDTSTLEGMLEILLGAAETFTKGVNAGDHAFCLYQLARCYKRLAQLSEGDRDAYRKSAEAYEKAAELANEAGDLRQRLIAEAHAIEIKWKILQELDSDQALASLQSLLAAISGFVDPWSRRVLRNALLLEAQIIHRMRTEDPVEILQQAWSVAVEPLLHASDRTSTDAKRAAEIFLALIKGLDDRSMFLERDKILAGNKKYVESWLGKGIDILKPNAWLGDLERYSQAGE